MQTALERFGSLNGMLHAAATRHSHDLKTSLRATSAQSAWSTKQLCSVAAPGPGRSICSSALPGSGGWSRAQARVLNPQMTIQGVLPAASSPGEASPEERLSGPSGRLPCVEHRQGAVPRERPFLSASSSGRRLLALQTAPGIKALSKPQDPWREAQTSTTSLSSKCSSEEVSESRQVNVLLL